MRALPAAVALLLSLSLLGPGSVAYAQSGTESRARELFENGAQLYDEGLYDEAIAAWQAAFALSPDRPLLLYNMANAYERLGRYQEALDNLNRYRALAPSDERETLERRMRAIERRMKEQKAPASSSPEADPLPDTRGAPSTVTPPSDGGGSSASPNPAGIVLITLGGAGLAVGGVLGSLALTERALVRSLCVDVESGGTLCPSNAKAHIDMDRNFSLGSDIALIAGGVALGAGVIILIADATSGGKASASNLHIVPSGGPDGAALTLMGRF